MNYPDTELNLMNYQYPDAIVSTEWLAANLAEPSLRIFDCTMYLQPADASIDAPYRIVSGRVDYEQAHIPGAGFQPPRRADRLFPGPHSEN